jgi:hypothetical protein
MNANLSRASGNVVNNWISVVDEIGAYNGAAQDRITVPSGVAKIRLRFSVGVSSDCGETFSCRLSKNGAAYLGMPCVATDRQLDTAIASITMTSLILDVVGGDYFQMLVTGDGGFTLVADKSYIEMEVVQ